MRATHKLKHNGRMQYQLFLKGIGVTLEDCIRFFREEFNRAMDAAEFDKHYRYNIRHNYGKEGSRINYAPHSCMKVISANSVGADDVHGCPFRLYSPADLKLRLINYGLGALHAEEVTDLARKNHYQLACQLYFEITHNTKILEGITHPNRYFELSQEVMGKRQPKVNGKSGPAPKGSQDIVLKKKQVPNELDDEFDEELVQMSKAFEDKSAPVQQTGKNQMQKDQKKTAEDYWGDDDDDLDISQIDDAIAMQY